MRLNVHITGARASGKTRAANIIRAALREYAARTDTRVDVILDDERPNRKPPIRPRAFDGVFITCDTDESLS